MSYENVLKIRVGCQVKYPGPFGEIFRLVQIGIIAKGNTFENLLFQFVAAYRHENSFSADFFKTAAV
jgi:hypothetical protein